MPDFELIAEREYDAVFPDGSAHKVKVGITRPYIDPETPHGSYRCDFVIYWPDGTRPVRRGAGVDSIQALSQALQHWHIETEIMKKILHGKISYLGSEDLL